MICVDIGRFWKKKDSIPWQVDNLYLEYNKSVEIFEKNYKLKADELFYIIIQLSRFFKDFCDFETPLTPDFRHPPIKGGHELEEIGK